MSAQTVASVATRRLARRFQRFRVVRSAAYRLALPLAGRQRVLAGQLATGSPIVVTAGDPAHRHIFFYGTYEPESPPSSRRGTAG